MATIDQQFVEYIVKTLVNNPEKVVVEREIDERGVLLSLSVDPEDVGAQSIRTLLRVLGTKNGARYNLKVVNTDEEGSEGGGHRDEREVVEDEVEETTENGDELAEKTRAELADLDDLEI